MVTIAVYLVSTLLLFYLDLKMVRYSPVVFDNVRAPQTKTVNGRNISHYKAIWERNLFGTKTAEDEKPAASDLMSQIDQLALTSLNCTLIGTIIYENGKSWAIIKQGNQQEKYQVGSMLSGAKVVLILRNKVVLNIDGKDELLVMGIEKIRAENAKNSPTDKTGSSSEVETYKVSKDFIHQNINNVGKIMSTARVKPVLKDGKAAGFQIGKIKQGSIFKTMGFRDNDIIKSVNGQDIRSAKDIMNLYSALKDSNFFSIGIVRNNQNKTLNYKVR